MKQTKNNLRGLGVGNVSNYIYLFLHDQTSLQNTFVVRQSIDGRKFTTITKNAQIISIEGISDELSVCSDFSLSYNNELYYLTYTVTAPQVNNSQTGNLRETKQLLCVAQSKNLIDWEKISEINDTSNSHIVTNAAIKSSNAANFTKKYAQNLLLMYCGNNLTLRISSDGVLWTNAKLTGMPTVIKDIAQTSVYIADTHSTADGIWVIYYTITPSSSTRNVQYDIFTTLFDVDNPAKILWHAKLPVCTFAGDYTQNSRLIGIIAREYTLLSYWQKSDGDIFLLRHTLLQNKQHVPVPNKETVHDEVQQIPPTCVVRAEQNPIMSPRRAYLWESKYVFNPAAIYEGGVIHILYRAIGHDDISVLGYASTEDGINITRRLPFPAYVPRTSFEGAVTHPQQGQDDVYASGGGGWGGCEDPKLTRIDNRIYLVYVAYNGWGPPRLAISWIALDDFLAHRWIWSPPVLISREGEINKSGCILPEKINNKYVIFHRVFPNILIDFVDSLDFDSETKWLEGQYKISPRPGMWDAGKLSVAAPPLRTPDGWLMIYHAVTGRPEWDGSDLRYKIGAMLLDINDPTRVLYRTNEALIEPETPYENDGAKYGIVYPCGAVIKDDTLFIYYGGSDEFVCVATAPIAQFLQEMKDHHPIKMATTANN